MSIGSVGGSGMPPNFDAPVVQEKNGGPSTFDILTRLALPIILGAVAYFRTDTWWFWGLVGVAFVPVGLSVYPMVKDATAGWLARWRDRKHLQKVLPSFERYVMQFGKFIGSDSTSQLGKIVESELRRNNVASPKELGMLKERVIQGFWLKLRKRIQGGDLGFKEGIRAVEEFNHLLHIYLRETVEPVYDQMPSQVRGSLPDQAKRELGAFRETLTHFVNNYKGFATELAENIETYHLSAPYLDPPKPHV